jgi:hypothetical protein
MYSRSSKPLNSLSVHSQSAATMLMLLTATFKNSVCKAIHSETWKVDDAKSIGVYREAKDGGQSLGLVCRFLLGSRRDRLMQCVIPIRQYTETPHVSHDVLSLTYRDGSTCPADNGAKMESVIAFVCDHGVFGTGQPEFVSSLGDCHFFCEHPHLRG